MKRHPLISSLMSLAVLSMLPACAATTEDPDTEVAESSKPSVVAVQGGGWEWVAPPGDENFEPGHTDTQDGDPGDTWEW